MGNLDSQGKDDTSKKSIADIREKIENLNAILMYFRNAFNPDAYDSVHRLKQEQNKRKLNDEFKQTDPITTELINRLAESKALQEKATFNFYQLKLFIANLEKRVNELIETSDRKAKGGRKTNELLFDFAYIEIRNYQESHGGAYPSASSLSNIVSKNARSLFLALTKGEIDSEPPEFKAMLLKEFEKREEKYGKSGTAYLPTETANTYLKRVKLEDENN